MKYAPNKVINHFFPVVVNGCYYRQTQDKQIHTMGFVRDVTSYQNIDICYNVC